MEIKKKIIFISLDKVLLLQLILQVLLSSTLLLQFQLIQRFPPQCRRGFRCSAFFFKRSSHFTVRVKLSNMNQLQFVMDPELDYAMAFDFVIIDWSEDDSEDDEN